MCVCVCQDARGGKRQGLDFLRFEWSGLLLGKMNVARINEPFGADNHVRRGRANSRARAGTSAQWDSSCIHSTAVISSAFDTEYYVVLEEKY